MSSAESFHSVDFYTDSLPAEEFVDLECLSAVGAMDTTTANVAVLAGSGLEDAGRYIYTYIPYVKKNCKAQKKNKKSLIAAA